MSVPSSRELVQMMTALMADKTMTMDARKKEHAHVINMMIHRARLNAPWTRGVSAEDAFHIVPTDHLADFIVKRAKSLASPTNSFYDHIRSLATESKRKTVKMIKRLGDDDTPLSTIVLQVIVHQAARTLLLSFDPNFASDTTYAQEELWLNMLLGLVMANGRKLPEPIIFTMIAESYLPTLHNKFQSFGKAWVHLLSGRYLRLGSNSATPVSAKPEFPGKATGEEKKKHQSSNPDATKRSTTATKKTRGT
eukprot:TRINITY_DN50402_c0_g1_i1.p1 TRINITY_DN50402_c0_g1~~TRINITY_DN50402_c0_g1_i1.p1  ORF type:complete len:251 (-),score=5.78 TRINITY_DN50402_c0_g1_i1:217-969(-)